MSGFSDSRQGPQLVHIATDGESYGHHHHYGEMALSFALDEIERQKIAQLTNYGEFLEKHPPKYFVEIVENSSWSCVHGVERWRSDCGCNSGGHSWNQQWRAPLRAALDLLRDKLTPIFESRLKEYVRDPWTARDDYIRVILDRSEETRKAFFTDHAFRPLEPHEQVTALRLLEMQRHALLMYTSCGWFFDELSGIESVQVIHYAGRALQLAGDLFSDPGLEPAFLSRLAQAKSNLPEHGDGARIYEKFVKPAIVDIPRLAAHYAIRSVFEEYGDSARIYSYTAERSAYRRAEAGKLRLVTGRAKFTSRITSESATFGFGVLHLGDHNVSAGIQAGNDNPDFERIAEKLHVAFSHADTEELIGLLHQDFGPNLYSLKSLFRDDQKKILDIILQANLEESEATMLRQYEQEAPLMRFLLDLHVEQPKLFRILGEFALNRQLRDALSDEHIARERIEALLREASEMGIPLDTATLEFVVRRQTEMRARDFWKNPREVRALEA